MKKEALFSISKKIIKTERNQTEFLKAVNDLPVLCLGSKLSISVIGGKTDIAEYTRINNIYSSDSDSNNDISCTEDSQTDPTSTNITANPDGDRIGRSQAVAVPGIITGITTFIRVPEKIIFFTAKTLPFVPTTHQ